jgi:hypothetical protein
MHEYQIDIENKINAACYGLGLSRDQIRDAIRKRMESSCDTLEDVLKRVLSADINLKDYCA